MALSSLAVARRVEPLKQERESLNPFEFAGGVVTPSPNDTVAHGSAPAMYLQIYPSTKAAEKPELTLDYSVDGTVVARQRPELPLTDADGVISLLMTPRMTPGNYLVRATVQQGGLARSESTAITVE